MGKETREYEIDAAGRKLGRLASEIANILQGKDDPSYNPSCLANVKVRVKNIKDIKISGRKAETKVYYHHSGRLGHLKETTYSQMFEKNPEWVLKHAVRLMLPKNRLAKRRLKNIIVE